MAWYPKEATAYGYVLTLDRLKKRKDMLEIINRYDGLFPKVVEVLFPDGYYHPPTPCDLPDAQKNRPKAQSFGSFTVPGPAMLAPQQQPLDPNAALNAGYDPYLQNQRQQQDQPPKLAKGEFPVSTNPENPLRALTLAMMNAERQSVVVAGQGADVSLQREPVKGPWPLVARRVPGVGPMPYERWGFALLPGYNGVTQATWPPHSGQQAPAGTLWATEQADEAAHMHSDSQGPGGGYQPQQQPFGAPYAPPGTYAPSPYGLGTSPIGRSLAPASPAFAPQRRGDLMSTGSTTVAANGSRPWGKVDMEPVGSIRTGTLAPDSIEVASLRPTETAFSLIPAPPSPDWQNSAEARLTPGAPLGFAAINLYRAKKYEAALAKLDERSKTQREPVGLRLVRGWSLLHLDRLSEAKSVFASLGSGAGASDVVETAEDVAGPVRKK